MSDVEDQLIDLQTQIAYQEDTIQALNDQVALQQQDIMALQRQMQRLLEDIKASMDADPGGTGGGSLFDDRPPHY